MKFKTLLPILASGLIISLGGIFMVNHTGGLQFSETQYGLLEYLSETTKTSSYKEDTNRVQIVLNEDTSSYSNSYTWFKDLDTQLVYTTIKLFEVSIPVKTGTDKYAINKYILTPNELKTLNFENETTFVDSLKEFKTN